MKKYSIEELQNLNDQGIEWISDKDEFLTAKEYEKPLGEWLRDKTHYYRISELVNELTK